MKRFLLLPLALGIVGAFFYVVCWIQFAAVILVAVNMAVSNANPRLAEMNSLFSARIATNFLTSYLPGFVFGLVAGLALTFWYWPRIQSKDRMDAHFWKNIFWCLCYACLPSIPNCIIGVMALYDYIFDTRLTVLPFISIILFNFTAIVWAAIRSITTNDVLTPRVLRDKLRQRARLQ